MKSRNEDEVYVSMDYFDSIESKRDLLEITASAINMQMIAERTKKLMKDEVSSRNSLKKVVKGMIVEINNVTESMPQVDVSEFEERPRHVRHHIERKEEQIYLMPPKKEEAMEVKAPKAPKVVPQKAERRSLNDELAEIKKKIESLKK